jgi:DNA-binding XRE family transcriptional regulator
MWSDGEKHNLYGKNTPLKKGVFPVVFFRGFCLLCTAKLTIMKKRLLIKPAINVLTCLPSACDVGTTIRKWRQIRSLKQEDLASKLEISRVSLSMIENGRTDITLSKLCSISTALGIEIKILLSDPGDVLM